MIVFLDGTLGVGKTAVIKKIEELDEKNTTIQVMEADRYFQQYIHERVEIAKKNNTFPFLGGGCLPQNNLFFVKKYREEIQKKVDDFIVISDMALTMKESKENLYDYFIAQGVKVVHIILEAKKETIRERILNDGNRDKQLALERLDEFVGYLNSNYDDAIRISTDGKDIDEITQKVLSILKSKM